MGWEFAVWATVLVPLLGCFTLPLAGLVSKPLRNAWAVILGVATVFFACSLLPAAFSGETHVFNAALGLGVDMTLVRNPPAPGSPNFPAYLQAASEYLLYVNALKLIMDPADAINAAQHVKGSTWPNLIPPLGGNTDGSVPQVAKPALAQFAICDQSVPNPFNALVASNIGLTPFLPPSAPGTGTVQWFGTPLIQYPAFPPAYPTACAIGAPHEVLIDWGFEYAPGSATRTAVQALTLSAQSSAAAWLASPTTAQPSLVIAP